MGHFEQDKINNILTNLSKLEIEFQNDSQGSIDYNSYETYRDYLSNSFIVKNNLAGIYWPQNDLSLPVSILEYASLADDLTFLSGHKINFAKEINFPSDSLHSMNYFNIAYQLSGKSVIAFENRVFHMSVGDLLIISPMTLCSFNSEPGSIMIHTMIKTSYMKENYAALSKSHIWTERYFQNCFSNNIKRPTYLLFHTHDNGTIKEAFLDGFYEFIKNEPYSEFMIESFIQVVFAQLLRVNTSNIESDIYFSISEQNYHSIIEYINRDYRSASLPQLASDLGFTKQHICKIIRDNTGSTFVGLLTEVRLNKVKEYLLNTSLPMEVICELTGFTDPAYLCRVFKKIEGIPPSAYRRMK